MTGLALSHPFTEPFYEGSAVSPLVPKNFHVAIGGHPYMMDVRKYSRRTLPGVSEQTDQTTEPGEASLSREGFWRRSQSRFDHGAGQEFLDEEGADRRRFRESKGVDIWTHDRALCLLNSTELKGAGTPSTSASKLLSVGGYLYVADGTNLRHTSDPSVSSPTWTTIAAGGTIADIATDGVYVYVAITGSAIQRAAIGASSFTAWATATAQPDVLAYANGRLLMGDANVLAEVASDGTPTAIYTDPRGTSATWVAIAGTPGAAFAALNAGSRGYIYALTVDDVSTAIAVPRLAGELPVGESVNALTYYGGVLLIGTSKGLRAAIVDTTQLQIGEVVEIADTAGGVRCFAAEGRYVWFGWSDYDSTSTGVGRVDLASNISENTYVPAYASDVMGTAQGNVLGVARHGGRTYFTVSGDGLFGETGSLVESGTFSSGWIRYSTLVPKLFTGVQVGHDALEGTVAAAITLDDGTDKALGTSITAGSTSSEIFDAGSEGVAVELTLTLTRESASAGPCVRFWTLHALPVPSRVDEIIVPLILAQRVTDLRGREWIVDPLAEVEFLRDLRTANTLITYQEGDLTETVRVDNVGIGEGEVTSWMEVAGRGGQGDRVWFAGATVLVRLLTKENA